MRYTSRKIQSVFVMTTHYKFFEFNAVNNNNNNAVFSLFFSSNSFSIEMNYVRNVIMLYAYEFSVPITLTIELIDQHLATICLVCTNDRTRPSMCSINENICSSHSNRSLILFHSHSLSFSLFVYSFLIFFSSYVLYYFTI